MAFVNLTIQDSGKAPGIHPRDAASYFHLIALAVGWMPGVVGISIPPLLNRAI
jgi:hypothetical protein